MCVCVYMCVCVLVTESCLTLCDPMDYSPPGSSVHRMLQARTLEWVAMPSSRGIFPTQGLNPGLLHCRQILYHPSHPGSPPLTQAGTNNRQNSQQHPTLYFLGEDTGPGENDPLTYSEQSRCLPSLAGKCLRFSRQPLSDSEL